MKLQRGLEGCPARVLVRLHSNRVFYAEPEPPLPRPVGRPRRHGERFYLKDPSSWPEPTGEHRCESEDYGSVRAWSGLHPKTQRIGERYGCEPRAEGFRFVACGHGYPGECSETMR